MDKYLKLQCVKGLLMGLEEQLGMRFQKDTLPENVKTIIVDKYYDAIKEQLKSDDNEMIKMLHKRGIISDEDFQKLSNKEI